MVFDSDFRHVLPVIPKGSRQDIVKWILKVGDGELGEAKDGDVDIDVLEEILIDKADDPVIFAPTKEVVDNINEHLLEKFPGEEMVYLSVPDHSLALKVGVPMMLLRHIDQPNGLYPTKKCHLLAHGFRKIISYDISKEKPMSNKELESKVEDMVEEVKTKMGELFGTYKERFDFLSSNSSMGEHMESEVTSPNNGDNDFLNDYYNVDATSSYETETELDRYLREPKIELRKGQSLDILQWWKVNGPRFPIVSKMARDILAIQISTVASEAAFSTGGRVLDPYRTRLSTTIVEALICTQDWVRKSRTQINWDDVEDLIKDDEIVKDMEEQLEKLTERDKAKQTGEI
ncbi:zinc finger BED domain-containing protein RICESLEEPER 2 [Tanacetum coccineum]